MVEKRSDQKTGSGIEMLEMRLRYERAFMDQLFEGVPEALAILSIDGEIVRINRKFQDLFGYRAEEITGRSIDQLLCRGKNLREAKQISQKLRSGKEVSLETTRRHRDGRSIAVSLIAAPIILEKKIEAVYAIYRDISERKAMEAALVQEKSFLEHMIKSAQEGIVIVDLKGMVMQINPEFTRIFQYSEPEAIGRPIADLVAGPGKKTEVQQSLRKAKKGEKIAFESTRKRKDGTTLHLSILAAPIMIDNKPVAIYGIYRDITHRREAAAELAREKAYLEQLIESAQEAIVISRNDGRVIRVNSEFSRIFGYTQDETVGKHIDDLVAPRHLKKEARTATREAARGCGSSLETVRRRKDGSLVDVSVLSSPIIIDGRQVAVYGIYRDISARKNAEAELISEKAYLEQLIENAQEAIVITDNNGSVLRVNQSFEGIFGYTREESLGQPIDDLVVPADLRREGSRATADSAAGKPVSLETVRQRKDGSLIDVSVLGSPIIVAGEQVAVYAIYRDISDRKQAERALTTEKAYLEQLIESAQEAIVITDNDGIIIRVNQDFERIFGYSRQESLGRHIDDLVAPDDLRREAEQITGKAGQGKKTLLESRRRRKDGALIHVSIMSSPIVVEGEQEAVYAIYRDITDRKNAEEELVKAKEAALQANEAKSEFLANMSHEIRTPMNGIIGMSELALDTDLSPEQREYLEAIRMSANSLMTIINDILDFSKIEAKKVEIETIPFNLRSLLNDLSASMALLAEKKGLEYIISLDADIPDRLLGDPGRIRQILLNLVGNAIKFTHEGEVVLSIALIEHRDDSVRIRFSVRDTGIGIPKAKQKDIFASFTQADGSTTRKFGGTGLGLSISSRLVELMNGKLGVESRPGEGSDFRFKLTLPVDDRPATSPPPINRDILKGMRVLVVDDNATNRKVLEGILRSWEMKPELAEDGREALALLDKQMKARDTFPLVLVDAQMPAMDGFQLVNEIGKRYGHLTPTVMMLTSMGVRGDAQRCQELGISSYLVKPVRQRDLLQAILLSLGERDGDELQKILITRHTLREHRKAYRILLAEDNPVNRKMATRLLEKEGHTIETAENGREAMDQLKRRSFDVILMDVQMPEMDGFEATRLIRNDADKHIHSTPIIAMTAHARKEDRERCLAAGMDEYISKPIQAEKLMELIEKVVRQQAASGENHPDA